ncbi:MAG: protein phosphatase CheZ [Rhodospirillales bacterium]
MTTKSEREELDALKGEITGLFTYVHRVREEIAAIHRPADGEHHLPSMNDQLDAIIEATENATNTIMESVENTQDLLQDMWSRVGPADQAIIDKVIENGNQIFEACSFQDITGQRVTKVMKSIIYVEQRVNALIELWGPEEIEKMVPKESTKTEDEKLLDGPQLAGQGISQAEIDALFD